MKTNLLIALLCAGCCGSAVAQNATDDFPNLPPGAPLTILPDGTASISGRIHASTDVDVFTFFVGTPSVLTVYATGTTDTNGVLRKPGTTSAGTTGWVTVATEEAGTGNFRISRTVEPGQYSIQVGGRPVSGAANEYGLRVELTPAVTPAPADIDVPGAAMGSTQEFGAVNLGQTVRRTFVVGNTGGSALNISGISLVSNDPTLVAIPFAVENGGARSIPAGGMSSFTVAFSPVLAGAWQTGIRIASSDPDESPWDFTVSGTGRTVTPPAGAEIAAMQGTAELPLGGTVSFGAVLVPSNADTVREVVIVNKGTADLTLGTVRLELLPLGSPLPSAPEGFFKVLTQPAPVVAAGRSTVIRFGAGLREIPAALMARYSVYAVFENNDADENPFRLTLTAEVQSAPPTGSPELDVFAGTNAVASNGSLALGSTTAGVPLVKTLTLRNTGTAALNVNAITIPPPGVIAPAVIGPFFVEGGGPRTIAAGASSEFRVVFNSVNAGEFTATLGIVSNDADENPYLVTVSARAEAGAPAAPEIGVSREGADLPAGGTLDFGRTPLTVAVRRTIQVANTGTGPLNVRFAFQPVTRSTTVAPLFFRFASAPFTVVPPGATRALTLSFQPMTAGTFESVLVISNNDADENPYRIRLTGKGGSDATLLPDIALSLGTADLPQGSTVDFGSANPGTSVTREVRIANTGTGDLRLGRITLSRQVTTTDPLPAGTTNSTGIIAPLPAPIPFRVLPPPNGIVPAGGNSILRVVYMAPAFGTHDAVLSIESNDTDESPYKLNLHGASNGTAPAPAEIEVSSGDAALPIGGTLDFGTVAVGTPARKTVRIANTGTGELKISSFMIMPLMTATPVGVDASGFVPTVALVRVVSGVPVIAPGAAGEFVLELLAFAPGTAAFQARVGNNDADENPYAFLIRAEVEAPVVVDPPVVIPMAQ